MAKKPEQRYATPSGLIESLTNVLTNNCRPRLLRPAPLLVRPAAAKERDPVPEAAESGPAAEGGVSGTQSLTTISTKPGADRSRPPGEPAREPAPALWREWLAVVKALAQGTIPEWSDKEYALLYRALLDGARPRRFALAPPVRRVCAHGSPRRTLVEVTSADGPGSENAGGPVALVPAAGRGVRSAASCSVQRLARPHRLGVRRRCFADGIPVARQVVGFRFVTGR